jgi:four helix bundle protein
MLNGLARNLTAGFRMQKPWNLRDRTILFATNVIQFCRLLPRTEEAAEIATQLRRSAASTGANYWASSRGRSTAEFIAKIGIAIEEADETIFWFTLLVTTEISPEARVQELRGEANEIVAILTASQKTAKRKQAERKAFRRP